MFASNPAKDHLRTTYDAAFVRNRFGNCENEVTYFGMPGPEMLDVKEWLDCIDFVIAVENKPECIGVMEMTAGSLGISGRTQILQGDVEAVLIDWQDDEGEIPEREAFDVVNLDYFGGLLGKGGPLYAKRIEAIRELFARQRKSQVSFVMFLTIGFRENSGQEYDYKLHHIREELADLGIDAQETITWYLSHSTKYKLKVYVPFVVGEIAIANRYHAKKYLCFSYKGTSGIPMMHFAFDFEYSGKLVSPRRIGLGALLDSPLYIAYKERVEPCPNNPPPVVRIRNEDTSR